MTYPYPTDQPPQGMPGQGMPTGPTPYGPPPGAPTGPMGYPPPSGPVGYPPPGGPVGYPAPTGPMGYPAPMPGAPNPYGQPAPTMAYHVTDKVEKSVSQMPLIAMIVGIVGVPLLCSSVVTNGLPILTGIAGVAAVALGHMALAQAPKVGQSRGNGLAITGLILGYLMVATVVVWLLLRWYLYSRTGL